MHLIEDIGKLKEWNIQHSICPRFFFEFSMQDSFNSVVKIVHQTQKEICHQIDSRLHNRNKHVK